MADERRLEPRYALCVPIRVGSVEATTINVSLSGVAFKSPVSFVPAEAGLGPDRRRLAVQLLGAERKAP